MNQSQVQCKNCGHSVQSREVLRTDLYEREPDRAYVYVKFRCAHCKRMGQLFIPEHRWDWRWLERSCDELNDAERDTSSEAGPITDTEVQDFHTWLKSVARWSDFKRDGLTLRLASSQAPTNYEPAQPHPSQHRRQRPDVLVPRLQ